MFIDYNLGGEKSAILHRNVTAGAALKTRCDMFINFGYQFITFLTQGPLTCLFWTFQPYHMVLPQ